MHRLGHRYAFVVRWLFFWIATPASNINFVHVYNGYAYVAYEATKSVLRATVNSVDGSLSTFASTTGATNLPTTAPTSSIIGITSNSGYVYITRNGGIPSIYKCTVGAGGDLTSRVDSGRPAPPTVTCRFSFLCRKRQAIYHGFDGVYIHIYIQDERASVGDTAVV